MGVSVGHQGGNVLSRQRPDRYLAELLAQGKRGFTLPVMRWMRGSMRPMCERSLESLKSLGVLRAEGIDTIWDAFLREPESPIWSRALTLCMLGVYIERNQVTA